MKNRNFKFFLQLAKFFGDSEKKIMEICEIAAKSSDKFALYKLGEYFDKSGDLEKAKIYYIKAADSYDGDVNAIFRLGRIAGKEGDLDKAREWFNKIANQRCPEAMFNLGRYATTTDEKFKWYLKSAEAGFVPGMFKAGQYAEDLGDKETAIKWYKKAAEKGDSKARHALEAILK